jgi:hypothetical protein
MFIEMLEEGNKLTIINSNKIAFMNYYDNSKTWKVVCTDGSYAIITSEEFEKNVRPRLYDYENLVSRKELPKPEPIKKDNISVEMVTVKNSLDKKDTDKDAVVASDVNKKSNKYKDWGK